MPRRSVAFPPVTTVGVAELEDGSTAAVTATVTGLPAGRFVLLPAEDRSISITNTYGWNPGSVQVTTVIDGPEAARRGPVAITVGCSNGANVSQTFDPGVSPTPIVLTGVPAFATCHIEEPFSGAVTGVGVITNGVPTTLTVGPGSVAAATVRNTYVPVEVKAETTTNGDGLARTGTDPRPLAALGFLLLFSGLAVTAPRLVWNGVRTSRR